MRVLNQLSFGGMGALRGTRTPNFRILSPAPLPLGYQGLERTTGIEPAPPFWKTGALPIELHPQASGRDAAWYQGFPLPE